MERVYGRMLFAFMVMFSVMLFAGCAKPPTEELMKAEKSVREAKEKEADLYAEEVYMKAEESMKKANEFVALKKYSEAKAAAEEAEKLAQQALSEVEANKAKMKAETEELLKGVRSSIDELKPLVSKAIKKKAPINREELTGLVGKWELDLMDVQETVNAGQVRRGHDSLKQLSDQVKAQQESVSAVLEEKPEQPKQ